MTEWVRIGLLDRAERVGRDDGRRGALYQWSDTQRDLLLTVGAKRADVRHVKGLVQIPVGVWLYRGDERVPLRQVRTGLATFTDLIGPPCSYERALANAREIVRAFTADGASRKLVGQLRESLALALHTGKLEKDTLRPLVEQLLKRDTRTGGWGPFGNDSEDLLRWMRASMAAIGVLPSISDEDFHEARSRLRAGIIDYATNWRYLARDPSYGKMFEPLSLELLMNRACRSTLGIRRVADEDGETLPPVPVLRWSRPPARLLPR